HYECCNESSGFKLKLLKHSFCMAQILDPRESFKFDRRFKSSFVSQVADCTLEGVCGLCDAWRICQGHGFSHFCHQCRAFGKECLNQFSKKLLIAIQSRKDRSFVERSARRPRSRPYHRCLIATGQENL